MEVAEKEPEDGQRTSGRSTETSKEWFGTKYLTVRERHPGGAALY
jgi:hypothetical protein